MFERIRNLMHRLRETTEVEALSDRDLEDLGLSRSQLLALLRMPQDISERVAAMGNIFGVAEEDLKHDHQQWVELLTVCGHCSDREACADVLAKGPLAQSADCGFCGNKASFAGFAARLASATA